MTISCSEAWDHLHGDPARIDDVQARSARAHVASCPACALLHGAAHEARAESSSLEADALVPPPPVGYWDDFGERLRARLPDGARRAPGSLTKGPLGVAATLGTRRAARWLAAAAVLVTAVTLTAWSGSPAPELETRVVAAARVAPEIVLAEAALLADPLRTTTLADRGGSDGLGEPQPDGALAPWPTGTGAEAVSELDRFAFVPVELLADELGAGLESADLERLLGELDEEISS